MSHFTQQQCNKNNGTEKPCLIDTEKKNQITEGNDYFLDVL